MRKDLEQIEREYNEARAIMQACVNCGEIPILSYEVGCTYIECECQCGNKVALPDWQPGEAVREWNCQE